MESQQGIEAGKAPPFLALPFTARCLKANAKTAPPPKKTTCQYPYTPPKYNSVQSRTIVHRAESYTLTFTSAPLNVLLFPPNLARQLDSNSLFGTNKMNFRSIRAVHLIVLTASLILTGASAARGGAAVPAVTYPPDFPACRLPPERCAGADGKPIVKWQVSCCDGACDTPHPDWGQMCSPRAGFIAPAAHDVENGGQCLDPKEPCWNPGGDGAHLPCCRGRCETPDGKDAGYLCTPEGSWSPEPKGDCE